MKPQSVLRRLIAQTGRRGRGSSWSKPKFARGRRDLSEGNESARSSKENLDHDTPDNSVPPPKLDRRVSVAPMMGWTDEVQFVF